MEVEVKAKVGRAGGQAEALVHHTSRWGSIFGYHLGTGRCRPPRSHKVLPRETVR